MSGESTSAYMSLPIPGVGVTSGPTYATDVNNCLTIIDSHNHSTGSGTQITPAGINISSDLSFLSNNAILLRSMRMASQSSVLALAADLNCLFTVNGDLYYNDGSGNNVRITQSGGVAGTPGSISNLVAPASAAYVAASTKFVWQSDTNTAAIMDCGSLILRNATASSFGMTVNPPLALGADFAITFPTLPVSQKIMTLDNTGAIAAAYVVDNSTIEISSNTIRVKAGGITTNQISASAGITGTQIQSATITGSNIASNVALAGTGVTINSRLPVVASTAPATYLKIIRGSSDLNGNITAGEGFSVSKPGTGSYTITYSSNFGSTPAMTVTPISGGFFYVAMGNATTTSAAINIADTSFSFADAGFSFIIIGPA